MRVLLVSKFYYPRGGDCLAAMRTEALLRENGHQVGVFTMRFPDNVTRPQDYFTTSQVEFSGSVNSRIKAFRRILGLGDVRADFGRALSEFRPEVVHLHNVHSYLSPVVARMAHEAGCRVVWTMHDYKLLCPAYTALRRNRPCLDCAADGPGHVLAHRCMKGSLAASLAAWLEAERWSVVRLSRWVDTFICPSRFMANAMLRARIPEEKLAVLPNFLPQMPRLTDNRRKYICYIGRISPEKGVDTLLEAVAASGLPLRIAGTGPLADNLRQRYPACENVTWLGAVAPAEAIKIVSEAECAVLPAKWYENNPLSVIEALCAGTPVVAARMGGLPELIDERENGLLVRPDCPEALAEALNDALNRQWNHASIAAEAQARYAPQAHYQALMRIYN